VRLDRTYCQKVSAHFRARYSLDEAATVTADSFED
jgi:hypothetical protein